MKIMIGGMLLAAVAVLAITVSARADGGYCREYQQRVTIGGVVRESYGTACMQPDGSWKRMDNNSAAMVDDDDAPVQLAETSYVQQPAIYEEPVVYEEPIIYRRPVVAPIGLSFGWNDWHGGHGGGWRGGHGWHGRY